ncbi:lytic transglycosylase domain-containing protein [Rhodobacteraceae bacterium CCMM004]|nr:lytic transglycosylase domain-containing protein [Rhodobacteraceae bacterium CCMM004]
MRFLPSLLVLALTAGLAAAQSTRPPPRPDPPVPPQGLAAAMEEVREGDWSTAFSAAEFAGPIARDIVEWHRLRAGEGSFDDAMRFLRRNGDWPGLPLLKRRMEKRVPQDTRAPDVIAYFSDTEPATGAGVVALMRAFRAIGADGDAEALAAWAWVERSMTAEAERSILALYRDAVAPLHLARLDAMLWEGSSQAARRMLDRVDEDHAKLAEARLALRGDASGIDTIVEAVPEALADDPGLAYERFRWRLGKDRDDEAVELLLERSVSTAMLGRPEAWARERRRLARSLMRAGETETAYALASSHWLEEGSSFADLEWLSGYLALTYLDAPERALQHFKRFRGAVETPISLGRAGYWEGRAHEALGNAEAAQNAYAFGGEYQTSFYGLLAAERAGMPLSDELAGREVFPDLREQPFRTSSVLRAGLLLQAAGERDLAERFLVHLGETLTREEQGTLGTLALRLGEPHIALMIAKGAARQGYEISGPYFPVVDLGVDDLPVARELALAIARRESEFDPGVASGVGASGLMQLMPGTARDVAGELNLPYSRQRLFTDPVYNATLGSHYLAGLIERFGNNPILVSAGYNAGPGRPLRWMTQRGDPRSAGVDMIDWIEHIPFDETRNYVMRVAESLPVYRARLAGSVPAPGPLRFLDELKGQ